MLVVCAACGTHASNAEPTDDASAPWQDVPGFQRDATASPQPAIDASMPREPRPPGDAGPDPERDDSGPSPSPEAACEDDADCADAFCVGGSCCSEPCNAPPPCHQLAEATCPDGTTCVYPAVADGAACDDGDPCTDGDACVAGACVGTPLACDDADACTLDACEASDGTCQHTPVDCDDADICTTDACDAATGACTHEAVVCDDGDLCTDDACDPVLGCVTENNAAPCEDGDSCTTGDTCSDGSCQSGARDACGVGQLACTPGDPNVCECDPPYEDDVGRCAIVPPIPDPPADCPVIETGTITVLGQDVELWVGEQQPGVRGPLYFYWHGTGGEAIEAAAGIGEPAWDILAQGGVIASFTTTTGTGTNTGNGVWYTGDFAMADVIVACAKQQLNIDTARIYTGGCSAGGLQASAMAYRRSSYLAAAAPNSGGVIFSFSFEDPSHVPAVITAHGAMGVDFVGVDFSTTSLRFANDVADAGGFAVDCDHGGEHCAITPELQAAHWQFLQDHPYRVSPEPYAAGLPAGFPDYCTIIE